MRLSALILPLFALLSLHAQTYQPNWDSLDKRPNPAWFTEAKFGIFIHWGTYSVPSYAPVIPGKLAYSEWYWNALTEGKNNPNASAIQTGTWAYHQKEYGADFPYQNFAAQFKAELFDPDHWADVFARSGAKYVAITSKHHEGFALWPSKEASATWGRPWNSVETGPKRDLLGDLSEAVRRKGLKMGVYYSLYEWYNPLWLTDKPRYVQEHMIPQFKDLVTHYKPAIIFSDGEWELTSAEWHSPEMLAWLFNESPVKDEVVVNDRWGKDTRHKHGGYWTTEYTAGMSGMAHPWEENRGMGFSYGYNRAEKLRKLSLRQGIGSHAFRSRQPRRQPAARYRTRRRRHDPRHHGRTPAANRRLAQSEWRSDLWHKLRGKPRANGLLANSPKVTTTANTKAPTTSTPWSRDPAPGKARIEAFFTTKGNDLYAILPRWPGNRFTLKDVTDAKSVTMLGMASPLTFKATKGSISVDLPELPEALLAQPSWVLKVSR